jgi:hypothetical protein
MRAARSICTVLGGKVEAIPKSWQPRILASLHPTNSERQCHLRMASPAAAIFREEVAHLHFARLRPFLNLGSPALKRLPRPAARVSSGICVRLTSQLSTVDPSHLGGRFRSVQDRGYSQILVTPRSMGSILHAGQIRMPCCWPTTEGPTGESREPAAPELTRCAICGMSRAESTDGPDALLMDAAAGVSFILGVRKHTGKSV